VTPKLIMAACTVTFLVVGAGGLYWKGRLEGAARERPRVEAARAEAQVSHLEAGGERQSAERAESASQIREAVLKSVIHVTHEAQRSENAHARLDPARLARLRAHDHELCVADPELAGCSEAGDAATGAPALRAAPVGGRRDPG
jgi:hypothetical protein